MRLFKRYTPGMIAKHVSRLFKGRIYIYGVGKFEFDNGKLILPAKAFSNRERSQSGDHEAALCLRLIVLSIKQDNPLNSKKERADFQPFLFYSHDERICSG